MQKNYNTFMYWINYLIPIYGSNHLAMGLRGNSLLPFQFLVSPLPSSFETKSIKPVVNPRSNSIRAQFNPQCVNMACTIAL